MHMCIKREEYLCIYIYVQNAWEPSHFGALELSSVRSLLIYAPLCHWVWGPGGWIAEMGALDFAGGTAPGRAIGVELPPSQSA